MNKKRSSELDVALISDHHHHSNQMVIVFFLVLYLHQVLLTEL